MSDSLEQRVQRIEDRQQISETVVRYAISLDTSDWELFKDTIADPIFIDFSEWSGMEAREWGARRVGRVRARRPLRLRPAQHLSPNHVIDFRPTTRRPAPPTCSPSTCCAMPRAAPSS